PDVTVGTAPFDGKVIGVSIVPGLMSDAGPLGIEKPMYKEIAVTRKFVVTGTYGESRYPEKSSITVNTSVGVDISKAAKFITLSPSIPFTVEPGYSGFSILGDFKPRDRYTVTVLKGLPSRDGMKLEAEYKKAVIFPDLYPQITFPSAGTFLSPAADLRIPLETVNIEEVNLNLWRVYENNIPVALTINDYSIPRDLTRRTTTKTARPEGSLNTPVRRAIDLRELAGQEKGVFLVTASDAGGQYWGEAEQLVAVTDLGIVARLWPDGITVWVNSIAAGKPVPGSKVKIYSKSNQLLASGETDEKGLWAFRKDSPWEDQLQPLIATVEKDEDLSFLKFDGNLLSDSGFDTGGRPWNRGYEAFLFPSRGVFRPGEEIFFSTVVRNSRFLPPESFPVIYVVRSSLGKEVARGTAMLSPEGMAVFSAVLSNATPTGVYSAVVALPGEEKNPLGRAEFFVEDFVAPRLAVKAVPNASSVKPGETVTLDITSEWLFGAPAAELPFEGEVRVRSSLFAPSGWEAYSFGDPEKTFEPTVDFLGDGKLDPAGKGQLSWTGPEEWSPPSAVELTFVVRVMEEGGRWVPTALSLPFHPYPVYLGIEKPQNDPTPGKETTFAVAAVSPEGTPSPLPSVKASLYSVSRHYNLVRTGNQTRTQVQRELVLQSEQTVPLKEGRGKVTFTPPSSGEYLLRIDDEASGSAASHSFYSWAPWGSETAGGSTLLDRIEIRADREVYAPGDTATVTFRAPFKGNVLVTAETDHEILRRVLTIDGGEGTIEIPVTAEMIPNFYVSAWVIRPVLEGEPWGNHRALGIASLKVERKETRLTVDLEAPERAAPLEPLTVKGQLTDGAGKPRKGEVVLYLVDEGILSLTNYATPDPWAFFMSRRAAGVSVFDIYDQLLPLEARSTPLLRTGGGEGEDAMAALRAGLSPVSAKARRVLSLFAGSITTDDKGAFTAEFSLPEFSGRARLMAVAVAGDAFGKGEKAITLARDVTAELSLPRAVSPGDDFTLFLELFSAGDEPKEVTVSVSVSGPLTLAGKKEFLVELGPKNPKALFSLRLKAAETAGVARLTLTTAWDGNSYVEETELAVRPPWPPISLSGSGVLRKGEEKVVTLPRNWFPGTEEGQLLLSDFPSLDLLGAVSFLMAYPYGCLEQTVSGAWPLLVLPDLVAELDSELVNEGERENALAGVLRKISALQLSGGGFVAWPGNSGAAPWVSIYTTHFLVEARKSGTQVPEDLMEGALSWVRQFLPSLPENDTEEALSENMTLKAYASYVLALAGEAPLGWMAHIGENRTLLRNSGAIFLAGSYAVSLNSSEPLKELGTLPPALRKGSHSTFESSSRTNSLKLLLWAAVDPLSPTAAELALPLLKEARKSAWGTTQQNAMAVLALGRWLERTRSARKPFQAVLKDSSGAEIAAFSDGKRLSLNLADLPQGPLTLALTGEGTAYYAWTAGGVPEVSPPAASRGLSIKRTWKNRAGKVISKGTPVDQGERIEVTLSLTPAAPLKDLVVIDILPGGMEIENPRLSGGAEEEEAYRGIRAERRDDRLLLFVDSVDKPLEYRYLLRAVTRGTFTVPPLAAEGMYAPDVQALTGSGTVVIR
ncbi:MAG: alpha-2-macroglobulin family protein, partial [Synergistaceae bacterium]|nr:alpha-2-macroglobulin family protein [Synergistaceae bacterium]